jgi:hypothetical protein
MSKRVLSLLLVLCMLVPVLPLQVFAAGTDDTLVSSNSERNTLFPMWIKGPGSVMQ